MSALVSILIPVYNTACYLCQCLDSVINQSYGNLQIVIVDDGSKDDSLSICLEYARKDQRIEVYHKENAGVAAARNDLLSHIKGDFFLFVDSDDWIEPDMVNYLLNVQLRYKTDIVTCGLVMNEGDGVSRQTEEPKVDVFEQQKVIEKFLYHTDFRGSLWNKLFRTELLHQEKFNPTISYGEDALFCWHLLQRTRKVAISDRGLYHYRVNEDSISHATFGPKKLSAHYVWEQICEETQTWWPQYKDISNARHCIEDTLLLRDAAHSGYSDKADIAMLQKSIKFYWIYMKRVNITSTKMKGYAWISSRSFWLAGKF